MWPCLPEVKRNRVGEIRAASSQKKKKKRSKFTSHSASAFFCTRKYAAFFEKVPTVVCMQYSHYRIVTTLSEKKKKTPSDAEKLIPKDTIFREHVICGLFFVPRVCQEITTPPVCCAKMTGPNSSSLLQPPFPPAPAPPTPPACFLHAVLFFLGVRNNLISYCSVTLLLLRVPPVSSLRPFQDPRFPAGVSGNLRAGIWPYRGSFVV